MIKRMFLVICILSLLFPSLCNAADPDDGYGTMIAVEIRVNSEFRAKGFKDYWVTVGKLEYRVETIELITFTKNNIQEQIVILAEICNVYKKKIISKGVHQIECQNQNGVFASGTIDFRDKVNPKVTLLRGVVEITNISAERKKWHKKYIPNIFLGQ